MELWSLLGREDRHRCIFSVMFWGYLFCHRGTGGVEVDPGADLGREPHDGVHGVVDLWDLWDVVAVV
jgi:hypothetical protein